MMVRALAHADEQRRAERPRDYIWIEHVAPERLTLARIRAAVTKHYGLLPTDLRSRRIMRRIAHPRQVAMYLCRELTERTIPEIAASFGGRDHSTVLHAINKTEERLRADPKLAADIEALRRVLA
jgi:chromosomal replication initiator protein